MSPFMLGFLVGMFVGAIIGFIVAAVMAMEGCCCLFDKDENQINWCSVHAELRDERDALEADYMKLRAFWEWSRLADKMTFEQYHWTKQALRGGEAKHD